ncbi:uncharacterized protein LOC129944169 [Eupeodes corollae]|uniref:uncharacterized protein LOC129944169 n=1 Tax=Eupeodes corollae TaxID=290404 RepID=UPI0024910C16|nr:uncharacterized protein LOC129944169 [Eupeodes corollae]
MGRHILPKGDSQLPMICQNTNCHEDGSVTVEGCGRIPLPNCTLIEEGSLMKSYPECCEMTYQCIDEDGNTYKKQWNQLNPNNSNAGTVSTDEKLKQPLILKLLQFF